MVEGIGIVTCIYVALKAGAYCIINYRIYDVDQGGRTKLGHVLEMLVWVSLTRAARTAGQTIYQLKESLLDDYIRQQLQKLPISINIA